MKRIISVILAVMMLLSCFAGLSLTAYADTPQNGWYEDDGDWQYYKNGKAVTGWQYIGKNWYYFSDDGWMYYDDWYWFDDEEAYYVFGESGAMLSGGWVSLSWTYGDGYTEYEWFYTAKNGKCLEGWQKINNKWYYLEPYAYKGRCEIPSDSGTYYYFGEDCAMCTGWIKADSYYGGIRSEEVKAESTFESEAIHYYGGQTWFYANSKGALQKGWQKINNKWYFFDEEDFYMYVGPERIKENEVEKTYYFDENGAWVKSGWCSVYGSWFYLKNGEAVDGWQYINNKWYYFDDTRMAVGGYRIEGKDYLFDGNGAWVKNPAKGWNKVTASYTMPNGKKYSETGWFYFKNGSIATGWQKISGKWYYFRTPEALYITGIDLSDYTGPVGYMYYSRTFTDYDIGKSYAFGADGAMITKTGWNKIESPEYYRYYGENSVSWVYVKNTSGELQTDWKSIGGKWYYFYPDGGTMISDTAYEIGDKYYFFGKDGALVEKAGWASTSHTYSYGSREYTETTWYYLNADGTCFSGWRQVGGKWYYMEARYTYTPPHMVTGYQNIDGQSYEFDYTTGELLYPSAPVVDD